MKLAALFLLHNANAGKRRSNMFILRALMKLFHSFCRSEAALSDGIDSHKWESKVELIQNLSKTRH